MRRRSNLVLGLGLVLALLGGGIVFAIISQQAAENAELRQPKRPVVVATRDIAAFAAISPDALVVKEIPSDLVPAGALKTIEEGAGKVSTVKILAGQMIVTPMLLGKDAAIGASARIPTPGPNQPAKVLIALPASDLLAQSGAVRPGDRVDLLLTLDLSKAGGGGTAAGGGAAPAGSPTPVAGGQAGQTTQVTVQNLEVVAVGQWPTPPDLSLAQQVAAPQTARQTAPPAIFVFAEHQDALAIKFVKDSGGIIDLALRGLADRTSPEPDPVTLNYLMRRYRLLPAQPAR